MLLYRRTWCLLIWLAVCLPFPITESFVTASVSPALPSKVSPASDTCHAVSSSSSSSSSSGISSNARQDGERPVIIPTKTWDTTSASTYHLLWSPGVLRKMSATAVMLGFATFLPQRLSSAWLSTPAKSRLFANVVLPLLASACCAIQLWLNLFAVGCAGFNTFFGPLRPYFLGLLFHFTWITFDASNVWLAKSIGRWFVALLPEAVDLWNRHVMPRLFAKTSTTTKTSESIPTYQTRVQLSVPTMGCVACINTIDQHVRQVPGVVEASSSLLPLGQKGGTVTARVVGVTTQEIDEVVDALTLAVTNAGFDGSTIESMRTSPYEGATQQ